MITCVPDLIEFWREDIISAVTVVTGHTTSQWVFAANNGVLSKANEPQVRDRLVRSSTWPRFWKNSTVQVRSRGATAAAAVVPANKAGITASSIGSMIFVIAGSPNWFEINIRLRRLNQILKMTRAWVVKTYRKNEPHLVLPSLNPRETPRVTFALGYAPLQSKYWIEGPARLHPFWSKWSVSHSECHPGCFPGTQKEKNKMRPPTITINIPFIFLFFLSVNA